jgi:hypothetical protein
MGSSHSSEPEPEPLEVEPEVETEVVEEEDPVDDFLENSIRWMFGIA